jgi:hypothetical protein
VRTLGKHVNGVQNAHLIDLKRVIQMVTIFKGHILSALAWKTEKQRYM